MPQPSRTRTLPYLLGVSMIGLAACATTPREQVAHQEDSLGTAGFIVSSADTPQRQAMFDQLPPFHLMSYVRGTNVSYIYADPAVCNCLYVGTQPAFDRFAFQARLRQLPDQEIMSAQVSPDSHWDRSAWGPGPGW